jgi:hypothetical protein
LYEVLLDDAGTQAAPKPTRKSPTRDLSRTIEGYQPKKPRKKKSDEDKKADAEVKAARTAAKAAATKKAAEEKLPLYGLGRAYLSKKVAFSPVGSLWMQKSAYAKVSSTYLVGIVCDYKYSKKEGKLVFQQRDGDNRPQETEGRTSEL